MNSKWQPIETAPKDGTRILLSDSSVAADGYFDYLLNKGNGSWVWPYVKREPTHWATLPEFPKQGERETSTDCEHSWMFAGTVYSYKSDPRPDGSVVDRIYEDHYYCTKCLEYRYTNVRKHGHSHTYPIAGSRPK